MAILQILQYPDLRLRRKSTLVTDIQSEKIRQIIKNMVATLNNTKDCAALAATQLDIVDPPNIMVINHFTDPDNSHILCFINTQIISKEGERFRREGCMSVYPKEISAKIKRAAKITVEAFDPDGNKLAFEATDYFASCIQHECDHLRGVLYIDYLSKSKRSRLDKKIATLP